MAVEDILSALEDKAANRIEAIKSDTQQKVNEVMSEAESEASRTRRMKLKKIQDGIKSETTSMVYSASLKAKNELIKAQEEVVDETFKVVSDRLADLHGQGEYAKVFEVLLDECLEYIDGEVIIQVREDDLDLLVKLMEQRGVPFKVSEAPLEASGGLVASSADGMIVIQNSFESRLEKAKDNLRLQVSNALFGS